MFRTERASVVRAATAKLKGCSAKEEEEEEEEEEDDANSSVK